MSRGTAYYDLPNGERIELPTTMPDVEEVPGPLCDGKFELPEAVKEMFKWMDETFGTWESDFSSFKIWMKLRKNFNPPVRWEAMQDKRRNPKPLGRNTYLYKARKIKSLARSTHTRVSLHKGKQKGTEEQCKHTFKISSTLEVNAPEKYYLSARACQGILTRASRRGKKLPDLLQTALLEMIEWWEPGAVARVVEMLAAEEQKRIEREKAKQRKEQVVTNAVKQLRTLLKSVRGVPEAERAHLYRQRKLGRYRHSKIKRSSN